MPAERDEQPRILNCAALRTLHELQLKLRRQINDLMAIECDGGDAAEALQYAIELAKWALDHAREAHSRILRGE